MNTTEHIIKAIGFDVSLEWKLLLYSLILGAALAVLFDILRISRVFISEGASSRVSDAAAVIAALIGDVFFFTVAGLTVTVFVFHTNHGDFRGFVLVGAIAGFSVYLATVGRVTSWFSHAAARLIRRILAFIKKRLLLPVLRLAAGITMRLYGITLGRLITKLRRRWLIAYTDRAERELCRFADELFKDSKEVPLESGTDINTCKAHDLRSVHISDNNTCERTDPIQQPSEGTRRNKRAYRRGSGGYRRASE